ncbi:ORFL2W_IRL [Human betaherpesvirus 5]|nr:ORFL2C [Human betaherpesvirus 5]QHX40290.1 ORFL2C_TRL [Human betaherpesvirus 5]QHX40682.1 ORFL2W_IRL [Human betaherpesvirus 5]
MENALFYLSFSPKPRFLPILMFSLVYLPPYKKRSTSSVARIIPSANLLFCSFFFSLPSPSSLPVATQSSRHNK